MRFVEFESNSQLTHIAGDSFSQNPKLESVIIPSSLEMLTGGFHNNASLQTVSFAPNSQLEIITETPFKNSPIKTVYLEQELYDKLHHKFENIFTSKTKYYNIHDKTKPIETKSRPDSHFIPQLVAKTSAGKIVKVRDGSKTLWKLIINDSATRITESILFDLQRAGNTVTKFHNIT